MINYLIISIAVIWYCIAFLFWLGKVRTKKVLSLQLTEESLPKLSIVVAAKDEEKEIESSLRSILKQNYPNLEVIVVNDRSTDRTGLILENLQVEFPNLKIETITSIPVNWLGKNNALWKGANDATGDYILFTDADVKYSDNCLRKIMTDVQSNKIEFACCFPDFISHGFWESVFNLNFAILLSLRIKFWSVTNPKSSAFCGVGAFNLVKKESYFKMGGHSKLPLEVADDMVLAKLMKQSGAKSALYSGKNELSVKWQSGGLKSVIKGIEKNAFSGFNYSWMKMILQMTNLLIITCVPFAAFLFDWKLGLFSVLPIAFIFQINRHFQNKSIFYFLTLPIGALLLTYASVRSALIITLNGSVNWRDTKYSKSLLKKESKF